MKFTWAIITYKYADYSNSNTWDGVLSEDRREKLIFFSILNIERSVHLNVNKMFEDLFEFQIRIS